MALKTRSKFWYGPELSSTEIFFQFKEGMGPVLTATFVPKVYTPELIAQALASAMNAVGTQIYTVNVDRSTRKLFIDSDTQDFTILSFSNPLDQVAIYQKLGFDTQMDIEVVSGVGHLADNTIGTEYLPQFYLLDYVPSSRNQDVIDSTINESGSGVVEVITFGLKKMVEFTIDYINDYSNGDSIIETNPTAVADAEAFMANVVKKSAIEFMPDRDTPSEYAFLRIETTQASSKGLGFKLIEKTGEGLTDYYTTGLLKFREV